VREIGLKKAVGAHTGQVLREYLLEATTIGLIGGIAGFVLGAGATTLVTAVANLDLFLVTPYLAALSIGFAIVLGAVAGVIPAFRAARLDPVTALRSSN
jgi:putative ABC transport system permease protein